MSKDYSHGRKRVEDSRFLMGRGNYVDDMHPKKVAYLGFVRSPYAHAIIEKVDFSKAKANPDFIASLTGDDLEGVVNPLTVNPRQRETGRYHLAVGKARFMGEPVAAILSKSKYAVEDIIESVDVEYRLLPSIMNIEDSKRSDVKIYDAWNDNLSFTQSAKKGDADSAIASAPHVIKTRLGVKRQEGAPIEPRSVIASYDAAKDEYMIYGTVQSAFSLRDWLTKEMKIPPAKIHSIVRDVGGGFGTKGANSYPEPVIACLFAKSTGMTVKWTSTRTEDLLETAAGRDHYCDIELACDSNGTIVALRVRDEADVGVAGTLSMPILSSILLIPGQYKIPNISVTGVCYVTNKAPHGPVRGAGRPEGVFFIERAIDIMARQLQLDPVEFRRRNLIQPHEMPYSNGTGGTYDSGNFPLLLETLCKSADYDGMKSWRDKINIDEKGNRVAGIGICVEVDDTGSQLKETTKVSISAEGKVRILTGLSPHGQGLETSLAELVSNELGVPFEDVTVSYGDSSWLPWGIGTFGSRSMATGGSSIVDACRKTRSEILSRASRITGVSEDSLSIENGEIVNVAGGKGKVAEATEQGGSVLLEKGSIISLSSLVQKTGPIESYSEFALKAMPFASGAHLCALTIDRETGKVAIQKYVAADDCGVVVNHVIVEGQLHGGIVHGIGGSLLEEVVYNKDGQLLTSNFSDYTIPTSLDIPREIILAHIETPSTITLNGSKGVGESGTIGAYPAVFNALNDALFARGSKDQISIAPALPEDIIRALGH